MLASMLGETKSVENAKPVPQYSHTAFANSRSIRFLVVGDWGTGSAFQRRVAKGMNTYSRIEQPQFIISTGDNFYPNGAESPDDKKFTTHWKNIYSGDALQLPWYVVLGNHDYRSDADAEVAYSKRDSMWIMPARYYSFTKNMDGISAEFFMIDTEMLHNGGDAAARQREWLDRSLRASSAQWKIVVGHHMIRSHGAYKDQPWMLEQVKPLLDKYGVQLYMNGHDHDMQYLRSPQDGFACLISGAGGGARNTSYGENTRLAYTNGGFAAIALMQNGMYVHFMDSDGNIIYEDRIAEK